MPNHYPQQKTLIICVLFRSGNLKFSALDSDLVRLLELTDKTLPLHIPIQYLAYFLYLLCSILMEDLFCFSHVDFALWNSDCRADTQCGSHRTEVRTYYSSATPDGFETKKCRTDSSGGLLWNASMCLSTVGDV